MDNTQTSFDTLCEHDPEPDARCQHPECFEAKRMDKAALERTETLPQKNVLDAMVRAWSTADTSSTFDRTARFTRYGENLVQIVTGGTMVFVERDNLAAALEGLL